MRIKLASITVNDQEKALKFYTETLGFKLKNDMPAGPYRWLTVTAPDGPNDLELLLEPDALPAAKTFQEALYAQKIPATIFETSDANADYEMLKERGVNVTMPPTKMGPVTIVQFDDTVGNLIQLVEPPSKK